MKNFKKVIFALMVVFLVVGFIGCKTESDPPKAPVVTNNFKGNVFVAEYSEGPYSYYWGYIEFIDDTNGKMVIAVYAEGNPIITEQPFTYSVTDDKATLKATMEGEEYTVTTEKLTDGRFTFSMKNEETGETALITCTKGDKSLFDVYTVYHGEVVLDKGFFYKFEDYVKVLVEEDDYNLDTANKKIVLTENGYKKCNGYWTIVYSAEEVDDYENYINTMLMFNMIGLNETDYTIDIEALKITVTDTGMKKIEDATWTISYPDGGFEETSLEFMLVYFYEDYGLVDGDYTKNDETKTITLTESGWEKVRWTVVDLEGNILMSFANLDAAETYADANGLNYGIDFNVNYDEQTITLTAEGLAKIQAGAGGDDSGEVTGETWTVMYNGITVETFESLEAAGAFASNIGLVENVDYTVNNETQTITLTDAGWIKVQAMGGGSEEEGNGGVTSEKWTGVDPEGIPFTTFESFEEVKEHVEVNGLELGVDYTVDEETHTITLVVYYYYMYNGEPSGGKSTLEDFPYEAEHYGLEEGTDYTIDRENKCINFTDSGYAKVYID